MKLFMNWNLSLPPISMENVKSNDVPSELPSFKQVNIEFPQHAAILLNVFFDFLVQFEFED